MQQRTLSSAKSMPSLDQSNIRQNPRSFYPRGGGTNSYRSQRYRHNSYKSTKPQSTPDRQMVPPPPPPFPPPSPSQPTSNVEWSNTSTQGRWIRGNIIGGPSKILSSYCCFFYSRTFRKLQSDLLGFVCAQTLWTKQSYQWTR